MKSAKKKFAIFLAIIALATPLRLSANNCYASRVSPSAPECYMVIYYWVVGISCDICQATGNVTYWIYCNGMLVGSGTATPCQAAQSFFNTNCCMTT